MNEVYEFVKEVVKGKNSPTGDNGTTVIVACACLIDYTGTALKNSEVPNASAIGSRTAFWLRRKRSNTF